MHHIASERNIFSFNQPALLPRSQLNFFFIKGLQHAGKALLLIHRRKKPHLDLRIEGAGEIPVRLQRPVQPRRGNRKVVVPSSDPRIGVKERIQCAAGRFAIVQVHPAGLINIHVQVPCLSGSGSMPMKPRTNAYPSLLLYNLFAKNRSVPPGSHKYQGEWSQLDQIILSSSLTDTTSQMQLIPGSARIFSPSFLLIKDKTWRGERPFRTYYGFKYEGGYSDHLPLIVDFLLLK